MSNFCGPNMLKAKYFTQVFSLNLFFKLEIKHRLPERRNRDLRPGKFIYVSLHAFRLTNPGQQVSDVPRRGVWGVQPPPPYSQVLTKPSQIPSSMEYTSVTA
jgi:hypothetical protein